MQRIDIYWIDAEARVSLNAPCHCGTGKRYRKCCAEKDLIHIPKLMRKAQAALQRSKQRQREFEQLYGHIRMPESAWLDGHLMFAMGGKILRQRESGPRDFATVVHDIGLMFFGEEYLEQQEQLPFEQRHVPIQWMHAWCEEHNKALVSDPDSPEAFQIGAGAAWQRFAFDVYTISDNSELRRELRRKLLDPSDFQGARHELRVAAWWIAAGFDIAYENEKNVEKKHPEFVAKCRFTGTKVAVEAKSKHRTGVQGFNSGNPANARKALVRELLVAAQEKHVEVPLYAFLDLNLPPPDDDIERDKWLSEIERTVEDMYAEGLGEASPLNAVFFSNDPSHYLLRDRITSSAHNLWFMRHTYATPRYPHPDVDIVGRIEKAHQMRCAPPAHFWNDEEEEV